MSRIGSVGGRVAGAPQGIILALAGFFPVMAIVSMAPAVPTLLTHFQGTPAAGTLVPLMVTAPGLMIALTAPLMGWACDRFGRRPLILAATLFYGLFGTLPFLLGSLPVIFASRLALGLTEAAILTVTNVLIADYFDQGNRRVWLAVQSVLGPILGVATITSSGLLTGIWWNGAFLIYLTAFLLFVLMVPALFEPARDVAQPADADADAGAAVEPAPSLWPAARRFVPLTLFGAVLYYVYIVQAGFAFGAIGLTDPGKLGGVLALASVAVPVGGVLFGWMTKRFPFAVVLATMLSLLGTGMIVIGLARSLPVMIAGSCIQQAGAGMCVVSLIYWVSLLLPPECRGRGFGVWTSMFFLGQFVSPALAGPLNGVLGGIQPLFVAAGITGLAGAAAVLMLVRGSLPAGEPIAA